MRRTRYWACRNCGAVYHRRKSGGERPYRCSHCGGKDTFRSARSYAAWIKAAASRYNRERSRRASETTRITLRHSKPRGAYGNVLRLSTPTRRAWRHFVTSKNSRSFENRGQEFVDALALDIWTCPHFRPESLIQIQATGFHRPCHCVGGGSLGSPAFLVDEELVDAWGDYRSGLRLLLAKSANMPRVQTIRIKRKGNDDQFGTAIHESQHWIDSFSVRDGQAKACAGSHSKAFYDRMGWLAAKLGYELKEKWT